MGFPNGSAVKNLPVMQDFDPQVGKIPWRRKWQPSSVFLPGKFHGMEFSMQEIFLAGKFHAKRSLAGYVRQVTKSWTRMHNWTHMRGGTEPPKSHRSRIPNLQDLMPDDLRWNWHNNNNMHSKCNKLESSWNHLPTLIPGKTDPGVKKAGRCCHR